MGGKHPKNLMKFLKKILSHGFLLLRALPMLMNNKAAMRPKWMTTLLNLSKFLCLNKDLRSGHRYFKNLNKEKFSSDKNKKKKTNTKIHIAKQK